MKICLLLLLCAALVVGQSHEQRRREEHIRRQQIRRQEIRRQQVISQRQSQGQTQVLQRQSHGQTQVRQRESHGQTQVRQRESHGQTQVRLRESHGQTQSRGDQRGYSYTRERQRYGQGGDDRQGRTRVTHYESASRTRHRQTSGDRVGANRFFTKQTRVYGCLVQLKFRHTVPWISVEFRVFSFALDVHDQKTSSFSRVENVENLGTVWKMDSGWHSCTARFVKLPIEAGHLFSPCLHS